MNLYKVKLSEKVGTIEKSSTIQEKITEILVVSDCMIKVVKAYPAARHIEVQQNNIPVFQSKEIKDDQICSKRDLRKEFFDTIDEQLQKINSKNSLSSNERYTWWLEQELLKEINR